MKDKNINFYEVVGHFLGEGDIVEGIVADKKFNQALHTKKTDDDILFWNVDERALMQAIETHQPLSGTDFVVSHYSPTKLD